MDQTIQQLETLLKSGDREGARSLIAKIVSEPLSDVETGEAYVALTSAYLDAMNSADAQYIEALEKAVAAIKTA